MANKFSKKQSKSIKRILGFGYAKQIQLYLTSAGILNANSKPYSEKHLYQIVNGQKTSSIVQEKIEKLIEEKKIEQNIAKQKRQQLLG